jgi:hypothetical protein
MNAAHLLSGGSFGLIQHLIVYVEPRDKLPAHQYLVKHPTVSVLRSDS